MELPREGSKRWAVSGAVLFETVLVLGLFFGVFFWGHLSILRRWRERVENLQSERLPYDGVLSDRGGVRP